MSDEAKFRTMDWLVGLATLVALTVASWALIEIIDVSRRVAVIEATRFTSDDAKEELQPKLDLILLQVKANGEKIERLERKVDQ